MNPNTLCVGCMEDDSGDPICPKCGRPFELESRNSLQLKPRTILRDQYLIGRTLGHGGFGITYLAWDIGLESRLAVKEYMPNGVAGRASGETKVMAYSEQTRHEFEWGLDRFLEEARVLKKFSGHPGIVSVDTIFRDNGTAYLVMEYLDGMTFEEFLSRRGGKVTFETALRVMLPVIEALKAVHAEGILHRDISPDNIHLTRSGKVKLIDFGAARNALGQKSRNLSIILKEGYAPEEQYRASGIQGPWTDVYAAAATLYHSITGKIPQPALDRQAEDKVQRPSEMGVEMERPAEAALMKALAVKAADRFQSMQDFGSALTGNVDLSGATKAIERNDPRLQALAGPPPPPPPPAPVLSQRGIPPPPPQLVLSQHQTLPPPPAPGRVIAARPRWMWPAILGAAALISIGVVMNRSTPDEKKPATGDSGVTSAPSTRPPSGGGGATPDGGGTQPSGGGTTPSEGQTVYDGTTPSGGVTTPDSGSAPPPDRRGPYPAKTPPFGKHNPTGNPADTSTSNPISTPVDTGAPVPGGGPTIGRGTSPPGNYESMANEAEQLAKRNSFAQAAQLYRKAIELDPSRPRAYAGLGQVQLYYMNDLQAAAQNYQAALARGGDVIFHVYHDHGGGNFAANCKGWLHVSKSRVSFIAFDGVHHFQAPREQVQEARKNRVLGNILGRRNGPAVDLHAFHIRLRSGPNYNFAPMSRFTEAERDMILNELSR